LIRDKIKERRKGNVVVISHVTMGTYIASHMSFYYVSELIVAKLQNMV